LTQVYEIASISNTSSHLQEKRLRASVRSQKEKGNNYRTKTEETEKRAGIEFRKKLNLRIVVVIWK
jgi:hypothetical protein